MQHANLCRVEAVNNLILLQPISKPAASELFCFFGSRFIASNAFGAGRLARSVSFFLFLFESENVNHFYK